MVADEAAGLKIDEVLRLQPSRSYGPAGDLVSAVIGKAAIVELGPDAVLIGRDSRSGPLPGPRRRCRTTAGTCPAW